MEECGSGSSSDEELELMALAVALAAKKSAPKSPEQWRMISAEFSDLWQFPHPIGAIDGKHIRIKAPRKSGTNYHNYKGYFSLQLQLLEGN